MSAGVLSEDSLPDSGHVLAWGEAQGVNGYGGGRGGAGGKGDVKIPVGVPGSCKLSVLTRSSLLLSSFLRLRANIEKTQVD